MANTSYYGKKKEESDKKIQAALEARKKRTVSDTKSSAGKSFAEKKEEQDKKINEALSARSRRIESTLQDVLSDIQKNITVELDAYNSTEPAFGSYESTYKNQRERRIGISNLRSKVNAYRKYLDNDQADRIISALDQMVSGYDAYLSLSSFDSEDDYNFWKNQSTLEGRQKWYADSQKKLKALNAELEETPDFDWTDARQRQKYNDRQKEIKDEISKIETDMRNYERGNYSEEGRYYGSKVVDYYQRITERPDFAVISANRNYSNPTKEELDANDVLNDSSTWRVDADGVYKDAYGNPLSVDSSGNWVNPSAKSNMVTDRLGMFLSASEAERQEAAGNTIGTEGTWATVIKDGLDGNWDQLEDTEVAIYYALLDGSQQDADRYLDEMKPELNRRATMESNSAISKAFDEATFLEKIALNAATVPAQAFSNIAGSIENTANTLTGNDINPYSAANSGMHFSQTVRGKQAEELDATGIKIPVLDFTLGDLYQTGMSRLDSAVATKIFGGGGTYFLGMGAAQSEAYKLYQQGASPEQITVGSFAAGTAEAIFEHLSYGKLKEITDVDNGFKWVKSVLVQGWNELSEEALTEVANIVSNALVMGNQSDLAELYKENKESAFRTFLDLLKQVSQAGFGGFLGGLGAGMVQASASYNEHQEQNSRTGEKIMKADGGVDALKALALDVSGADSKLAKQANKVTGETYTGEGLIGKAVAEAKTNKSQKAVGKLYNSVQAEISTQNKADIAKSLEKGGFSQKSAKNIADAIVARANGEELSKFQKATLDSVKGNKIVDETVKKIINDPESSVSKRTSNMDIYSMGISLGKGIAPNATVVSAEKEDSHAAKNFAVSENGKMMNTETKEVIDTPVLAQAEDGTYMVVDKNAGLVSSENVSYESHDQGMVVESFVNLSTDFGKVNKVIASMDLASRNKLMSLYNPEINPDGGVFVNGVLDAYFYGHRGVDLSVAQKNSPIYKLTEQQRQIAWETGRAAGEKATAAEQSNVDAVYAEAKKVLEQNGKKKGTYHATLEAGISPWNLTPEQKVVYNVADEIAQSIQTNIRVYNGTNTAQGFYNHETDEIMLNLNAANKGRDAIMAFTLAHEIVHRAKKGSPAKYQAFTEFLMKEYGKQGSDVEAMIQEQMDAAEKFNKTVPKAKQIVMTEEKALEEVVCDACATMLLDTNAGQKLAEFGAQSKENRGFLEDLKRWISDLLERLKNYFKGIDPESDAAREFAKFEDNVKQTLAKMYVEMATESGEKLSTIKAAYGGLDSVLKKNAEAIAEDAIITDGAVVTDGERSYSIKSMKADIADGKMFEDLKNVCGWTQKQVNELKQNLEDLVEYMTPFRDILDMNETYGREGRRFSPYKPNSDPLYKISMDFSTLCSKRLLTQYVIENLQLRENRPMSAEEQMAIRDMLNEYRKVEKGLQVACAMCYVEAARLKSPKQINKWLDDPATQMRNYFADKNPEFAAYIKNAQGDYKESKGYNRDAPKKDMKPAHRTELNKIRPRLRSQYKVSAEEAQIIERAKSLPNSTYLTAGNLANLSETDPVIYSAYTAFVRTATRSKSLETDEPYYYGDSTRDNGNGIVVTDSFIESVNKENGMRFSSWSDWRIQHMLDYITAVIDNSVRGAAMHGYTKFGDEVRVLGKTGMMFNMSGVAGTQTGLNEDGSLSFSDTESIDVNEAIQLREEFPETAGLQCIGVSNDHIVALLRSDIIDYVIPYHVSGLNAGLRAMANIHGWDDYTSTQHEAIDKSIKLEDAADKEPWREAPVFSEFFVGYDTGMTGIEAMRASADRYVQMCKDRGLKPKFEQFLGEENYWKLLIDRKMINQKTGNLIQQRAVTPTFDFNTIKSVVDKYSQNYDSGLESRALNHVVENWDSIPKRIKDLKKQGGKKAKKASKAVDTLSNQTLAAQPNGVDQGKKSFSLPKADSEGNQLSAEQQEFFKDSKVRDDQGRLIPMYHGTNTANFTVFDPQQSDDHISLFFTSDPDVANTYTQLQDKGRDVDPYNLITKDSSAEQFNAAQERVGGGLRVVKITPEWIQEMKAKAEKSATRLFGIANKYADLLEYNNSTGMFSYDIERIREVTSKGVEKLKPDDIYSKLRKAMGDASQHSFFARDHKGAEREIRRLYSDTFKLFDEVWNYKVAAATPDSSIGQYTYTETNSSVPFMIDNKLDFLGHIIPKTEKEAVAQALDRMQWVEEHHLGNRYKVYLNIKNPYVLDAGVNYSGKMDRVSLERRTFDDGWRVEFENAEHDVIKHMTTTDFTAFIESAFDAKTTAKIKAQIEADNEAYRKEWGDDFYEDMDVGHDIQLQNVHLEYMEPGNWNALNFNGNENARTRDVAAWAKEKGYDGVIFKNMKDTGGYAFVKGRGGSTVVTAFSSEQVKSVDNLKPTSDPDIRYRLPKNAEKKITLSMTDAERTDILKDKVITAELYEGQAEGAIKRNRSDLESGRLGLVKAALTKIADEFDVFTEYNIKDVKVKLELSKSNIEESVSKKITPEAVAKLMPVLKNAVEYAIGIESHANRYFYDTDIVRFDNLVGGYVEGEDFVPVRFGLKHRRNGEVILYVIVDQQKIPVNKTKAEVVKIAGTQKVQPEISRSAFKMRISDIVPFVNSGDLLRYLPDNMLSEDQKKIKWEAIADTIVRTNEKNDAKYAKYIREGKLRSAGQMVKAAAKDAGYTTNGYHGSRTPGFTVVDKYLWLWLARDEAVASGYGTYNTVDSEGKPYNEKGVYAMRYNLGNNLVVYADGASWGELPVTEDEYPGVYADEETGAVTTDAMAEWAARNGYDSITFVDVDDGGLTTVDVVFDPQRNAKSADTITYDDDGNVIPLSQRFKPENDDIRYKLPIGEDTSPRALLANAFEGIITNDIEKRKIQEYKGKVEMLNDEEKKLSELRAQIKELSFAKGKRDTKKIKDLQFDANHTANRIATLDKMLLGLEASAPLQSILKREKEMAYKRGLEKNREKNKTARQQVIETREKRYAREKLQKLVIDTAKWISYPSKTDVKCPDILKQPYADFLNGIDLSSKRLAAGGDPTKNDLRLTSAMDSLATALDRVMASQDPNQDTTAVLDTGYLDLPAGFVQKLRDMTESVKAMMIEGEFVVNTMSAAEIRQLSQMIRTLNHAIKEVSTLYANLRFANVEALGDETMSFIDALGEIEKSSGMKDFIQWENALPYYAFKRFGNGGESIFEGLMDAQDKLAFLAQKIFDFQEKAWKGDEAQKWSEDTHTIDLPDGEKLTLTTADAMSIYCLSRREQGLKHLLGGGTRVMGLQKGSKKAQDSRSTLTIKDIDTIISSLTDRQRQVAEAIQEFMSSTCSEWGNEISMKRFLTKEFNEKFYFPIESNDENLPTKDPSAQQSDLFRLLNISATKPIDPRANNEVIIRNIFDVFTGHASDMARLNAFGMPLLDYMKWLNYREKSVNDEGQVKVRGVRKSMEKAYGNAAKSYVLNLIKDVNGRASDGGLPSFYTRMLKNAKTAMVGNSLRVATLQITSYPRAALVLSPKSLALGLSKLPKIDMAKKYCGIALWKSFGFYDTNISRSIEDQIKGVKDVKQKLIELSLKGAEWGDAITWGCLWNACEFEVAATNKYKVGTEEFYQAVGNKLREVVYATQVVDSTLTRSEMMRSKNTKAQELSAFMSEPTLSANILMDAAFEFGMEKRRTGSAKSAWKKAGKYVGRAVAVYSIGQLAAALLEGLWDAWRDDEDDEFGKKFLNAFTENLVLDLLPFNKIPIISDLAEAALSLVGLGYFSSDSLSSTALSQTVSAAKAWADVLNGNSSATVYNALYKSVRAISSYVGVSASGAMREVVALWNNTAGAYDITLKIRNWDLSKADMASKALDAIVEGNYQQAESLKAEFADEDSYRSAMRTAIKNRYNAGEIDYDTAMQYLIEYGGMEKDDAFWKAEEWEYENDTGEDFSKYNEFFTAVETGKNLKAVIKQYTDNGVELKTLASQITGHFKPIYTEMTASERAGVKGYLLNAFELCGVERKDAEKNIAKWQFEADYPELKERITYEQYKRWESNGKPNGVSIELYTEVSEYRDNGTSDSAKSQEEVAAYINSLPISYSQKDALWCCFWKESTLKNAPWH